MIQKTETDLLIHFELPEKKLISSGTKSRYNLLSAVFSKRLIKIINTDHSAPKLRITK